MPELKAWEFDDVAPNSEAVHYRLVNTADTDEPLKLCANGKYVPDLQQRALRVLEFCVGATEPFSRKKIAQSLWDHLGEGERVSALNEALSLLHRYLNDDPKHSSDDGKETWRIVITIKGKGFLRFSPPVRSGTISVPKFVPLDFEWGVPPLITSVAEGPEPVRSVHSASRSPLGGPVTRKDQFGRLSRWLWLARKLSFPPMESGAPNPLAPVSMIADPHRAEDVCDSFIRAPAGAEFIFRCVVFFEGFLHKHRADGVKQLGALAATPGFRKLYEYDHHRLDALPASAAAHLLGATAETEQDKRQYLADVLVEALRSEHPQVVEITFQNLISATAWNPDVRRYFRVPEDVLDAIDRLVRDRLSPESLGGLCSAMLFLLNVQLLHIQRGDDATYLQKTIQRVFSEKAPWAWYVRRFVELHQDAFKLPNSAPPYIAESCFGDPDRRPSSEEWAYSQHIALIYAKLFHAAYCQSRGTSSGHYGTSEAARRSYGKAGAHILNHPIRKYLIPFETGSERIPHDAELTAFLHHEFSDILAHDPSVQHFTPNAKQFGLAARAPFVRFRDKRIAIEAERSDAMTHMKSIVHRLDTSHMHERVLRQRLLQNLWAELGRLDPEGFLGTMPTSFTVDEVLATREQADEELGPPLDEQHRTLGPYSNKTK